ncbi:MAG TPA: GNAT family N-acetyltransferase [Clostridiales bacterium]|nr:GNAT family N-acetyltransferase [Clostridiales bacterium]
MIKNISYADFKRLSKDKIHRDFPPDEIREIHGIKKLYKKGLYSCSVMYSGEKMVAYGCFIRNDFTQGVLLDYLAVEPEYRGTGVGSSFLCEVRKNIDCPGLIIECECPETAQSNEEKLVRERRIQFYINNGATLSSEVWEAFNVKYNLLWLPVNQPLGSLSLAQEIRTIYRSAIPYPFSRFLPKYRKL